jgi:hypothetical protein
MARSIAQLAVPGFAAARLRILRQAPLRLLAAGRHRRGNQQDGEDARDDLVHAQLDESWDASVPGNARTARRIAEQSASCELYGLLKRPDEKYVTERAYDNPRFVEDIVREVALRLQRDARIGRFEVEAENFESIHTILRLHGSPI